MSSSPTKVPIILINTPPQKCTSVLSRRKNEAEDDVQRVAKCQRFSYDIEDATGIGQSRYEALMLAIKRQQLRLNWHQETLTSEKKKAKFYLGTVKTLKVRVRLAKENGFKKFCASNEAMQMREAEARKGFDLFRKYAKRVVPEYNWDAITIN